MCQISDVFKMADFCRGAQDKKFEFFSNMVHIIYHLNAFFILIDNFIRTKVLKSTGKKLLVIVSLVFHHRTLKTKIEKKGN